MAVFWTNFTITILLVIIPHLLNGQIVKNVTAEQEGSQLLIHYDLEWHDVADVVLFLSVDGGSSWSELTQGISGDVGKNVNAGQNKIVWDVLSDREELTSEDIQFKVLATSLENVNIGNQIWMSKNLNTVKFRNGDPIMQAKSSRDWIRAWKNEEPAWCYYQNDSSRGKNYGKLYNWYAVNDPRGLAPAGWHIPSIVEFDTLSNYFKEFHNASSKLKSETGWNDDDDSNIISGFTAFRSGYRSDKGTFDLLDANAFWWSSTDYYTDFAWNYHLGNNDNFLDRNYNFKGFGFSVRCIRD